MAEQSKSSPHRVGKVVVFAVVAVLALAYGRQIAETRRIKSENEQLRRQLAGSSVMSAEHIDVVRQTPTEDLRVPDQSARVDSIASSGEFPALIMTPTGWAAEPRNDGLEFVNATVAAVADGLQAVMTFHPTVTDPLGIVAVVVRLPKSGDERILAFSPGGNLKFADIAQQISSDGKFAVFQINAEAVEDLELLLTVSGPVTADVRGTCGIGPFDLSIGGDHVSAVRK